MSTVRVGEVVMPFGAHKGVSLCDIPASYLDWLIGQPFMSEQRNLGLRCIIQSHLADRPEHDWLDEDLYEDDVNHIRDFVPSASRGRDGAAAPAVGRVPVLHGIIDRRRPKFMY